MPNWNDFLRFNECVPANPDTSLYFSNSIVRDTKNVAQKRNIFGLHQGEEKSLRFSYIINNKEIVDVRDVLFIVCNIDRTERFRYTMADHISFGNGEFNVNLQDSDTRLMDTKYYYELWMKDSAEAETLLFKGSMKFKSTCGRFS